MARLSDWGNVMAETETYPLEPAEDLPTDDLAIGPRLSTPSMSPKQFANSGSGQTLNVAKAQRIIQAFTDDPSWLADPRTSGAANAVFGAASKVIGMNIQLERANAQAEAAKARNSTAGMVGKSLLKLAEGGGEGAKWAAQWYAPGNDGNAKYEDPATWADILRGFENYSVKTEKPTRERQLLNEALDAEANGSLEEAEILRDAARRVQSIRKTAPIQNAEEYGRLIGEAAKEPDPEKKALLIDQAQIVRGQKPATESISTTIRQVADPFGGTNTPTSLTNVTTRVTGPKTAPAPTAREHVASIGDKRMADESSSEPAPSTPMEPEMRPDDPAQRIIGKRYRSPSGKTATWTSGGWQE